MEYFAHYLYTIIQTFGVSKIFLNVFERKLHLFNPKYSKKRILSWNIITI